MHEIVVPIDVYGRVKTEVYVSTEEAVSLAAGNSGVAGCLAWEFARSVLDRGAPLLKGHVARDAIRLGEEIAAACNKALERLEAGSAIIAEVKTPDSGVGARALVVYEATGRDVPRTVDEGGDYHGGGDYPHRAAAAEAEARAQRAARGRAERIRRVGYRP